MTDAPRIRILSRTVDHRGTVAVDGLRYRVPARPGRAQPPAGARVVVLASDDALDSVLVRDPRTGALRRARCLSGPGARLRDLVAAYGAAEPAPAADAVPRPGAIAHA